MSHRTHIVSTNWASHGPLLDDIRPYRDQIERVLGLLDNGSRWSYGLWRAPIGVDFWDIDHKEWPQSYLQAGGTATRMAVEVRYVEDDGEKRQYAVGRPGGDYTGEPSETVIIGGNEFFYYPNEVFTAEQATDVFFGYFQTDRVPDEYPLRRLDFSEYE